MGFSEAPGAFVVVEEYDLPGVAADDEGIPVGLSYACGTP